MTLEAGQQAPDRDLPTAGGDRVSLADLAGRPLMLNFYQGRHHGLHPRGARLRRRPSGFSGWGVEVVGVSRDRVASHDRFKAKQGLPFPLASEEAGAVVAVYGVWIGKRMYGRSSMGIERSTLPIDGGGQLRRAWRKVKVRGHAGELLAAAKDLAKDAAKTRPRRGPGRGMTR